MDSAQQTRKGTPFKDAAVLAGLSLLLAGYPIAWLVFSASSPLGSTVPEFVNGFGAGVGFGLGTLSGVTLFGLAVVRLKRGILARRDESGGNPGGRAEGAMNG